MTKKSKLPWILLGVGLTLAVCCATPMAFTCFGLKAGYDSAAQLAPIAEELLTKMSDSGYDYEAVKERFEEGSMSAREAEQLKADMRRWGERLGKFRKLGGMSGFSSNLDNGVLRRSATFEATFEKGSSSVDIKTVDRAGKPVLTAFAIR